MSIPSISVENTMTTFTKTPKSLPHTRCASILSVLNDFSPCTVKEIRQGSGFSLQVISSHFRLGTWYVSDYGLLMENVLYGLSPANEPRCGANDARNLLRSPSGCTTKTITAWIENVSKYIKSLDPYHMVTIGDEVCSSSYMNETCHNDLCMWLRVPSMLPVLPTTSIMARTALTSTKTFRYLPSISEPSIFTREPIDRCNFLCMF